MKITREKLSKGITSFYQGAHFFIGQLERYLPAVVMVSLVCAGVYGVVQGQSGATIDVAGTYQASSDAVYTSTGDQGSNIQALNASSQVGAATNLAGYMFGFQSGVFGEEARLRAEEVGLPDTMKIGMLGLVDREVIALVEDPPGVDLPDYLARSWVPGYEDSVSTVYAQGEGYEFLHDTVQIEQIWEMMRNIAYAGFVVIIMVSGFMIMFRSKIGGGQVTVGIMNAIPAVIIGLVVVTFSFAIVGFIMDIGRLLTLVIGNYMRSDLGINTIEFSDPFTMAGYAFSNISNAGSTGNMFGSLIAGGIGTALLFFPPVGTIVGIIMLLPLLIMAAIAFYAAIKVYITLVMTYIKILMEVILGPLYILLGSLPGRTSKITGWIRRIVSHVLVFPVIYFLLNFAAYLAQNDDVRPALSQAINFFGGGGVGNTSIIQLKGVFVIALYFIAAGAPAIVTELVGAEESRGIGGAMEGAKKSAGKIPLVGGLLGG